VAGNLYVCVDWTFKLLCMLGLDGMTTGHCHTTSNTPAVWLIQLLVACYILTGGHPNTVVRYTHITGAFLASPLLKEDTAAREVHAIDAEYKRNLNQVRPGQVRSGQVRCTHV
jgi:hypothetical protein